MPLRRAIVKRRTTVVQRLLAFGADPRHPNLADFPVYHEALWAFRPTSRAQRCAREVANGLRLLDVLMEAGFPVDQRSPHPPYRTAFQQLMHDDKPWEHPAWAWFLDHGANPNAASSHTPSLVILLENALLHHRSFSTPDSFRTLLSMVQSMVSHGADLNTPSPISQRSPLHVAIELHHDLALFLWQHGADPNLRDVHGNTPLEHLEAIIRMEKALETDPALCNAYLHTHCVIRTRWEQTALNVVWDHPLPLRPGAAVRL